VGVSISFLLTVKRMTHESIPSKSLICMIRSKLLCLVFDTPNTKCLILVGPSGDFVYNGRCMDKILSIRLALIHSFLRCHISLGQLERSTPANTNDDRCKTILRHGVLLCTYMQFLLLWLLLLPIVPNSKGSTSWRFDRKVETGRKS
jgi:hypothetical protein